MYKIIGADRREYGPVSSDQIRHWILENRVNGQTSARAEGEQEWKPLSNFAEFADVFGTVQSPPVAGAQIAPEPIEQILARDYDLDIGACFGNAWQLYKSHFGVLFGGFMVYFVVEMAIGIFSAIPIIGALFSLVNFVIAGPLLGGLYYYNLRVIRGQPVTSGDVFAGFRMTFVQLFLGNTVRALLAGLCIVPAVIVFVLKMLPLIWHHQPADPADVLIVAGVFLVCMVPFTFLAVSWFFTLVLIIDRNMNFWPAMQSSWRIVNRHWWKVFGLVLVMGLLNMGGMLLCCVGVLFTAPWAICASMFAYEAIFGSPQARAA
jgi:hypothetical protein